MGRIAAERVDRLALKETLRYLRGRTRESVIGELRTGAEEGGWRTPIPVYETEPAALVSELDHPPSGPEVLVLLCHEDREEVFALLQVRGFGPVATARDLAALTAAGQA